MLGLVLRMGDASVPRAFFFFFFVNFAFMLYFYNSPCADEDLPVVFRCG
jgi:hypothetical protein